MRSSSLNRVVLLCLVILVGGIGLSCRKESSQQVDANKPDPNATSENTVSVPDANAPAQPAEQDVAAIVDGVKIKESAVMELLKPQFDRIDQQGAGLPPSVAEQYKKQLRQQGLEQLIRRQLLDEKIRQANVTVTDEEVTNQINQIAAAQNMSLDDFKRTMEQYGRNFDEVKEDVRKALSRNKFMEEQWAGKINVTEEDAKKYYDENQKRFNVPEEVRVSHILIQFRPQDPNADPNEAKAKAKAKAEKLLQEIKDGADFAELAKANSDCPSAPKGGDLGFFPRGKTTPEFEKVAFALKIGEVSGIVETEYGYHIIKATGHKDAHVISFDEAKDQIIKELTEKKQLDFAEKYIDSLKAQAKIVYPSKS
jgi:peptidyl-prolyl cis-trans isomerase C